MVEYRGDELEGSAVALVVVVEEYVSEELRSDWLEGGELEGNREVDGLGVVSTFVVVELAIVVGMM